MSSEVQVEAASSAPHPVWWSLTGLNAEAHGDQHSPRPFLSPYVAGVMLGLTLFGAFFVMGRGLGASGGLDRIAAFTYEKVAPDFAHSLKYYQDYWTGKGTVPFNSVLFDYALFQLLGTLMGGFTSAVVGRRAHLAIEKGPRIGIRGRLALAFLGGFIMAFGARLARGCTSGMVLTGSANLAISGLVMFICFFAGAYGVAYFARKQWI